ncbi:MAG: hypothetical protein ACRDIY_04090 [Chloroflexota bacterium]
MSGTTATDAEGKIVGIDDADTQAVQALRNVERALVRAGATLRDTAADSTPAFLIAAAFCAIPTSGR